LAIFVGWRLLIIELWDMGNTDIVIIVVVVVNAAQSLVFFSDLGY
jgi:hypothetical protein